MILVNESEAYEITYNGSEHQIPKGRFEVTAELGSHIMQKVKGWEKNTYIESTAKAKVEQVIIPEVKKESKKEDSIDTKIVLQREETKEDIKVDTEKVLKDAENFLK